MKLLALIHLFKFICLLNLVAGQAPYYGPARYVDDDLRGDYCRNRYPVTCCRERDDTCSVPILGTVCYCDMFCNRTNNADCCPDFQAVCLGISPVPPPGQLTQKFCHYQGRKYYLGQTVKINCNKCTCQLKENEILDFACEQNVCLVRSELINTINDGRYGWKASNYSIFWGKTLNDGIKHRLGTFKPIRPTMEMTEIHQIMKGPLPPTFDARQKWRNLITPIRDQGDCAASWAFSTTALASDRLAIESLGVERMELSPQHLLS
ncbi:Tubulointerstitial nephritis antigen-like protein, partial [Stegodyphus mimosarum]